MIIMDESIAFKFNILCFFRMASLLSALQNCLADLNANLEIIACEGLVIGLDVTD
jgi:hypothetical protein